LSFLLISCASRPPAPPPLERRATLPPHTITIRTSPPGGIVDWNGDVLGVAPVQIQFVPQMRFGRPAWPDNNLCEIFRARWPNGDAAAETFISSARPPTEIGIVCPGYRQNAFLTPIEKEARKKPALTQRTGP